MLRIVNKAMSRRNTGDGQHEESRKTAAMNIPNKDTSSLCECLLGMTPNLNAYFPYGYACFLPLVVGVTHRTLVS